MRKVYSLCFVLLMACNFSVAQNKSQIDTTLTLQQDNLRNEQADVILGKVNKVLKDVPPQFPENLERTLALYLLDLIFNDVHAPQRLPVQQFLNNRIIGMAEELESTKVEEGAVIWKLYSHSFVVRTKEVTIGFDLIRPSLRFNNFLSDTKAEMGRIIRQCDVLFISHAHPDHADEWVAQLFIEQGKPVVGPTGIFKDPDLSKKVTYLERDPQKLHTLAYQDRKKALKVFIYPGHQAELLNNVPIVYTPDGYCFSHNGDQNFGKAAQDTLWIGDIKNHHKIDILMYNQYMSNLWIKGFDPKIVITGHENELGHGIHSRHGYWKYQRKLEILPYPFIMMTWGEKYKYLKNKLL